MVCCARELGAKRSRQTRAANCKALLKFFRETLRKDLNEDLRYEAKNATPMLTRKDGKDETKAKDEGGMMKDEVKKKAD